MSESKESAAAAPKPSGLAQLTVSKTSQFSFGGESACAFGALAIAQQLLQLDSLAAEAAVVPELSEDMLQDAVKSAAEAFDMYFEGRAKEHSSPMEILQSDLGKVFYSSLKIRTWEYIPDEPPRELAAVLPKIAFPEAFLGMGDLLIEDAGLAEVTKLLTGFSGSRVAICFVTIGYAFGVFCCKNGDFIVFDTHSKSFSSKAPLPVKVLIEGPFSGSGAYLARLTDPASAAKFVCNVTLDSRAAILEMQAGAGGDAYGMFQSQAATGIQFVVVENST